MREIKFRAWDSKNKEMLIVDEIRLNLIPIGNSHIWVRGRGWIDAGCGYLMQYTGLKDKNGKEIYEGDIIKFEGTVLRANFERRFEVEWDEEMTGWLPFNEEDIEVYRLWLPQNCEVIGNIYENKELLE